MMNQTIVKPTPEEIRQIVQSSQEPLLIRGLLDWKILEWDLKQWSQELGDCELEFRKGKYSRTNSPQRDNTTEIVMGTFKDFLEFNTVNEWLYFDYKYLRDWLKSLDDLKESINWGSFGFANTNYEHSTIWIGNKGAHTSCHVDTYCSNLVAQIYGRKRWILLPPSENLQPTRLPYEESSIYSKINFFSPDCQQVQGEITKCKSIILEPGEVLFVPPGWWHYVENEGIAISINTWLPLAGDAEKRIEEALVLLIMGQLQDDSNSLRKEMLPKVNLQDSVVALERCLHAYKNQSSPIRNNAAAGIEKHLAFLKLIPDLTCDELKQLLHDQQKRFSVEVVRKTDTEDTTTTLRQVLEAITHPDVIQLIKCKLLESK